MRTTLSGSVASAHAGVRPPKSALTVVIHSASVTTLPKISIRRPILACETIMASNFQAGERVSVLKRYDHSRTSPVANCSFRTIRQTQDLLTLQTQCGHAITAFANRISINSVDTFE